MPESEDNHNPCRRQSHPTSGEAWPGRCRPYCRWSEKSLRIRAAGIFGLALTLIVLTGAKIAGPTVPKPVSPLASDKFQPRTAGPVLFRHQPHEALGISCTACHHDYVKGRNVWRQGQPVQKCGACHQVQPQAGRLDLKNAFHRQCKGCHLELRKKRRAAGPIKCEECHQPT